MSGLPLTAAVLCCAVSCRRPLLQPTRGQPQQQLWRQQTQLWSRASHSWCCSCRWVGGWVVP